MKKRIIIFLKKHKLLRFVSDKTYLKLIYYTKFDKKLNLKNPKTFNEKLQWLKLYKRNDLYTTMVDKYEVKTYAGSKIGEKYIIPTIGVYDKWEEIDFKKLPNKFVMKCTHDSGGVVICTNKKKLNIDYSKELINGNLEKSFYKLGREWPYKNVKPRIIIEEFIGQDLTDYRFYCFNGKVKYIYEYENKASEDSCKPHPTYCNVYDENWKLQEFKNSYDRTPYETKKPKKLAKMIEIAEELSKGIPFIRVDLYNINEKIYFGELTFYPGSGFSKFFPEKYDYILGDLIDLKNI